MKDIELINKYFRYDFDGLLIYYRVYQINDTDIVYSSFEKDRDGTIHFYAPESVSAVNEDFYELTEISESEYYDKFGEMIRFLTEEINETAEKEQS